MSFLLHKTHLRSRYGVNGRSHRPVSTRCRRSSSTQEQRYPPPLPLGATAPPTCGRRKSDPGLRVTTQDQEFPLRKLQEIRDVNLIAGYLYAIYYMKT